MSIIDAILSIKILGALVIYCVLALALEEGTRRLRLLVEHAWFTTWVVEHVLAPYARGGLMVLFILVSYPTLYGLASAPPLSVVLPADSQRLSQLLNLLFILPFVLPLLPVIGRLPAVILPAQGIAASALLFHWIHAYAPNVTVHYWPSGGIIVLLLLSAWISHEFALGMSRRMGYTIDLSFNRRGSGDMVYNSAVMVCQIPVILIYTLSLGQQLA